MRELYRARLIQANRSKVRGRPVCRRALVLCLLLGIAGLHLLSERDLHLGAARTKQASRTQAESGRQAGFGNLIQPVSVVGLRRERLKSDRSADGLWHEREGPAGEMAPKSYRALSLNEVAQRKLLSHARMEYTNAEGRFTKTEAQVVMTLPMPDGTFPRFVIEESPVMAAELAARFPHIRTYRGRGLDDATATTRLDVTPNGFHAIVLTGGGTIIVEPAPYASRDQYRQYISYDQRAARQEAGSFSCLVLGAEQAVVQSKQLAREGNANPLVSGATLRAYRLALAATAEFTQTYGGGTVGGSLSALTTMMNAVNAIYERDLAIHLNLVANETSIIFTNPATDGYTSDDVNLILTQNQAVLDQRIGSGNYDLGMVMDGHVYNFQPGKFIVGELAITSFSHDHQM